MKQIRLAAPALVFAAGFALLIAGCGDVSPADGDPGSSNTPRAASLVGTTYVVTGVTDDGKPRALVPGSEIRLRFEADRLGITAGCNSMSGGYRLDGTRLVVEPLASTEMGCEQALMDQDTWVAGLFASPVQVTTGAEPALISGSVVLALADREQVSPDIALTGTRWRLDSIVTGDAASSVPDGATARLRITGDRADVFDGCNQGSGSVQVADGTLTWGERTTNLMACTDPGATQVQAAVAATLTGETTFVVEERTLTITHGDNALVFRAALIR